MKLGFKKMHKDAIIPSYGHEGDSCMDLYVVDGREIFSGEVVMLSTGLSFDIPTGYFIDIRPRSSAVKNQLIILNAPGTIDSLYTGIVYIGIKNIGDRSYTVKKGDRLAQMRLEKTITIELQEIDELKTTSRGSGGFGSTGR